VHKDRRENQSSIFSRLGVLPIFKTQESLTRVIHVKREIDALETQFTDQERFFSSALMGDRVE
jgi:hypothetical protein